MAVSRSLFFFRLIVFLYGVTLVRSTKRRPSPYDDGNKLLVAELGDNITLPCTFNPNEAIELSLLAVHWSKDGVTKYFSNRTCCDVPGYDISEEDLQNGKAPLQLVNVQEEDAGVYTCAISYKGNHWSWNTTFHIQDNLPLPGIQTLPPVTPRRAASVVPEPAIQYRTLKYGLVSGVVVLGGLLVAFLYFCFQG
ncbi:hypothetical protein GDO81_023409 [Engystomops pustulosus]|uniref:Ig-like domain-containing protein n=1 Tax=Engystomops pustulosus TaxID=76066 RepID=A0AAV6YN06_ENGPU|nr:hypothetical protein GDO81_023409 [Engystomops pustulosus]